MVRTIQFVAMIASLVLVFGCADSRGLVKARQPFNIYVSGSDIVFKGTITNEANEYLIDLLESLESKPQRLVMTSSGGDAEAGIELGLLIHGLGLDVYIPSYCGSSCANYIFTAGNRKILGRNALLMWHGGATQEGIDAPPTCDDSGWYKDLFDCDADRYVRKISGVLDRWLEKETRFFRTIGVDQRITILGHEPEFRCSDEEISGWYYSTADLERLGVLEIEVLGGDWAPIAPSDEVRVCRVDLTRLPNNALHLQTAPVTLLTYERTAPYAAFQVSLGVIVTCV